MRWYIVAAFAGVLFVSRTAGAQTNDGPELNAQSADNSPLLALVPEAAQMSAPDWVKPGTRITFYGMAGSVPEGGYSLDKDPNGQWEDPATGERYSKNDSVGNGGEGFGQFDVIAVGKTGVALSLNLYTIIQPGNPPGLLHTPMGGMTAAAAGPADLWVHPSILQRAQQFHTPNFFMLRGNYPIGNQNYPCLCIVNKGAGAYSSHAYDLRTGVLISSTVTSQGKLSNITLPGEDAQRGNKGVTIVKFVSIRQVNSPGVNGRNPAWVANLHAMHFVGQVQYVNQFDPSIQMQFPARMDVSFGDRGDNWCAYQTQSVMQIQGAPPQTSGVKGVCGPSGVFWIDPTALTNLRAGQVLDEDPVTHIRATVVSNDGQRIVIASQGPGIGGQAMYDLRTGMLQGLVAQQPSSGMTITFQLQGTE